MQKKKRIRLRAVGKRLRRLTVYSITFIGVLLFGALNGVRGKESLSRFIITAIPVVVLGFFLIKHSLDRSISPMQVRETTEAYPDASPDELYAECDRLRRREIRLDALMLVIFAGFTLNWMLMLYLADASPLALQFDLWIMLPALLLVAAVLLIVSWIPPRKRTKIPLLEQYLNDAEQQKILLERKDKPDRRYAGCTLLIKETEEVPTMESAISAVRTAFSERRRKLMLPQRLGIGFLVITPGVLFLFTLPMLLFDGPSEISWIALLFGGLTIGGIALMISVRTYDSTFPYSSRKTKKLIRALYRQGHLEPDRVLSVLPDMEMVSTLEICFENAGLIRWKETDDPTYKRLLKAAGTEASVLMSGRELLAVFLNKAPAAEQSEELRVPVAAVAEEAPTAEETPVEASVPEAAEPSAPEPSVQKTAPAPEPTPVQETPANDPALAMILKILEDGGVPTDEQLREAGRIRFETMDPTKRKTYEDDLRELNQLTEMRGDQMTPAMQQRWVDLLFRSNRRESGERYWDLNSIESELMEKGGHTREEIANRKGNPVPLFPKPVWISLLIALAVSLGGALVSAWIEKETGVKLDLLKVGLSAATGVCAMTFAGRWLSTMQARGNFRKLRRAYKKPKYWDERIEAEAYKALEAQMKQSEDDSERD